MKSATPQTAPPEAEGSPLRPVHYSACRFPRQRALETHRASAPAASNHGPGWGSIVESILRSAVLTGFETFPVSARSEAETIMKAKVQVKKAAVESDQWNFMTVIALSGLLPIWGDGRHGTE